MNPGQSRRLLGGFVVIFAAALAGCDDEAPIAPQPPEPFAVAVAVTPSSGPVSTVFRPRATVTGIEPESLATLRYQWDYDGNGTWDTEWRPEPDAEVMYRTVGPEPLRVGVRDGRHRVATGDAMLVVTGGTTDGSRDFILVSQGAFTRGSDPNEGFFGD